MSRQEFDAVIEEGRGGGAGPEADGLDRHTPLSDRAGRFLGAVPSKWGTQ